MSVLPDVILHTIPQSIGITLSNAKEMPCFRFSNPAAQLHQPPIEKQRNCTSDFVLLKTLKETEVDPTVFATENGNKTNIPLNVIYLERIPS